MAKLIKDGHTVETELATEIASLRSHGYKDVEPVKVERPAEVETPRAPVKPAK